MQTKPNDRERRNMATAHTHTQTLPNAHKLSGFMCELNIKMQINQISLRPNGTECHHCDRFSPLTYVFSDWFAPFSIAHAANIQRNVHVFWLMITLYLWFFSLFFSHSLNQLIPHRAINNTKTIQYDLLSPLVQTKHRFFRIDDCLSFIFFCTAEEMLTKLCSFPFE